MEKEEVAYVATLARLSLSPEETIQFGGQLSEIFSYIEKLNELDLHNVEPTSHALALSNVFRADKVKPSLPAEKIMENAPDRNGTFFQVPNIIE